MIAFVGLGNVGNAYANTKHNAGFWVIDEVASRHKLSFTPGAGDYIYAEYKERIVVVMRLEAFLIIGGLTCRISILLLMMWIYH